MNGRRWTTGIAAVILGLVGSAVLPAAAAPSPTPPAGANFTVQGLVLDPAGRPVAGYPVELLPVRPGRGQGVDYDNAIYRIPDRDNHRTVSGPDGRFTMTGVRPYPQVKSKEYRVIHAGVADDLPYGHAFNTDLAVLDERLNPRRIVNLTIRLEPLVQLKLTVCDGSGRPVTGARVLTVIPEVGRPHTLGVDLQAGVAYVHLRLPKPTRGRLLLLRWESLPRALQEAEAHGQTTHDARGNPLGVTWGAVAELQLQLIPGRTSHVELTIGEP